MPPTSWAEHAEEAGLPHFFDGAERAAAIIILPLMFVGLVVNAFVAYLFWRHESLRRHPSNLLILSLCVGDGVLLCLPRVFEVPTALAFNGYPAWWHPFCQLFGAMPLISTYMSGLALSVVSLERYAAIVKGYAITRRQTCFLIAGIWAGGLTMGVLLPIVTAVGKGTPSTPFVLQSSGLYCLIDWGDSSPAGRAQVVIAICTIGATIGALGGGYFLIWLHVKRLSGTVSATPRSLTLTPSEREQESAQLRSNASSTVGMKSAMSTIERSLMMKGVIMSTSFVIAWSPYTCMILYEGILARHNVPRGFETLSYFGANVNAMINPILFIVLDTRVLATARRALGIATAEDDWLEPASAIGSAASRKREYRR
ncbi:hypothetical protein HDU87_008485 [Geranomyces variabilis]|uniref:G-protein coupled receptors family 1 profile domain-containing protein n=1 Tax=Geranomyces variabilis TaxID=109894 RepID=A0AAD5TP95_9FUNG|nr:hypothetical protein HDU87_008485 [Geranomyces variabilis]